MQSYFFNRHDAECFRVSRQSGQATFKLFLAQPDNQQDCDKAMDMCNVCNIAVDCLIEHFDIDTLIAGNTSAYERKLMRWKRTEDLGHTNWRDLDEFVRLVGGEEE